MARAGKKFVAKRPQRQQWPAALSRRYEKQTSAQIREAWDLVKREVLPNLSKWAEEAQRERGDARADTYVDDITETMNLVRAQYAIKVPTELTAQIAETHALATNEFNRKQMTTIFERAVGVAPIAAEPWLSTEVSGFVKTNVELIKSIPDKFFTEVRGLVIRGSKYGTRTEELAGQIKGRYKVSDSRARLIARDQTSKLNGDLTSLRQTNAGVTEYIWRTSLDERVRDTHAAKEGQTFSWNDPPSDTGHPGEDYQCRCVAEPVITI